MRYKEDDSDLNTMMEARIHNTNIKFLAYKNKKNRFFLTFKDNLFEGIKVEYVMIDTGCNSHLLPIKSGQLEDELVVKFGGNGYIWSLQTSGTANGKGYTLGIAKMTGRMNIELPITNKPALVSSVNEFDSLRFHLCRDDLNKLMELEADGKIRLTYKGIQRGKVYVTGAAPIRRKHALLGQSIVSSTTLLVQYKDVCMLLDMRSDRDWENINSTIATHLAVAAENVVDNFAEDEFSALEDEDHGLDDPDIHMLLDSEYIDE